MATETRTDGELIDSETGELIDFARIDPETGELIDPAYEAHCQREWEALSDDEKADQGYIKQADGSWNYDADLAEMIRIDQRMLQNCR